MKKIIITLFLLLLSFCQASQYDCYKVYTQNPDTLFMSSIAAINSSSKFDLAEIQSKNGYILFSYNSKFYLLTLTKKYQNHTEIKILPQNSNYNDNQEAAKLLFSLIDYQLKFQKMEQIK